MDGPHNEFKISNEIWYLVYKTFLKSKIKINQINFLVRMLEECFLE